MSAAPAVKQKSRFKLKVVAGPHQNEVYSLEHDRLTIGRGEENQIKLVQDSRVSRLHVEITWNGFSYHFKNSSQKNFVMLDGHVKEDGILVAGSKLQIGETVIEVFEEGPILVPNAVQKLAPVSPTLPPAAKPMAPPAGPRVQPVSSASPKKPNSASAQPQNYRRQVDTGRRNFYVILFLVLGFFGWVFFGNSAKKENKTFRTSQQVEYDLLQSSQERKKLEERIESSKSESSKRAQENLIKGFREFQQGNYHRARDNFQVVLNLDPGNAIAERYIRLSAIKFDELLQFNILQGLRYRDKRNYRMCRSSFQSALVMIQNSQAHPKYREIKDYFDECNLGLEGRY